MLTDFYGFSPDRKCGKSARELMLEAGINNHLTKPIDTVELNAMLSKWIPEHLKIETNA